MTNKPMSPEVKAQLKANRKAKRAVRRASLQQTGDGWTAPPTHSIILCPLCGGSVTSHVLSVHEGRACIRYACNVCDKITVVIKESGL